MKLRSIFVKLYEAYNNLVSPFIKPNKLTARLGVWYRELSTLGAKKYPYPKKTFLDYDWDYLIIIDACRHDLYKEVIGKAGSIISNGSCTKEWFNNTFENKNYDLIYVSGNPAVSKPGEERLKENKISFFKLEPVWDYGWDKDLKAVPPEEVTKKAVELAKEHPNKKIIIHYLQPHHPFIGENKIISGSMARSRRRKKGEETKIKKDTPWDLLRVGKLEEKEVWEAYKSNLELVMEEVKKLKNELDGRVILTSDHGNCKGEYGIYAHPRETRIEELVKVPWVVLKNEEKKIKKDREIKDIEV